MLFSRPSHGFTSSRRRARRDEVDVFAGPDGMPAASAAVAGPWLSPTDGARKPAVARQWSPVAFPLRAQGSPSHSIFPRRYGAWCCRRSLRYLLADFWRAVLRTGTET